MLQFMKKGGLVLAGGTIQGLGMGLFLFPHLIPSGGAGGITVLLNQLFHIEMGPAYWIVNLSMLIFAVRFLGKRFVVWTTIGITITSVSIHFFETNFLVTNRNLFIDLVFGSIFLGTGIGLLMRKGVSNGGVGVIAFMISHGRNILPGKPLFIINCSIFFLTAVIISWKIFLLALFSQLISTTLVDLICRINFYQAYSLGWRRKP